MSESFNAENRTPGFRRQLLTTVSAVALLAAIYGSNKARAEDTDQPTVWIELGGSMEHVGGQGENFPVAFLAPNSSATVLKSPSPFQAQNPPPFSFGEEGSISFQPENSDWVFSASVRFGRSSNAKEADHQTNGIHYFKYHKGAPTGPGDNIRGTDDFSDTMFHHQESHTIVDFSVGKDVGLGMFGKDGSSILNLGVRFAQFASRSTFNVRARPDLHVKYFTNRTILTTGAVLTVPLMRFHTYHATGSAWRNFHGIGPSLSWNASAPVLGNSQGGEVTFDWGANAAILFGKQKAHTQHQESEHYHTSKRQFGYPTITVYQHPVAGHDTLRSVIVPNIGGFAGASWRIENFKASLGYRADFFFGAVDGGIDTRKSETLGFYGPFASVSVGIGG